MTRIRIIAQSLDSVNRLYKALDYCTVVRNQLRNCENRGYPTLDTMTTRIAAATTALQYGLHPYTIDAIASADLHRSIRSSTELLL
jgi:hypothetical protein